MSKRRLNQYILTIKTQEKYRSVMQVRVLDARIRYLIHCIGRMSLLETDNPEGINQSINTLVQVRAPRHINETYKEKDTSSSMMRTKKSDKTNLQTQIDNQNSIKSYASALTSIEKNEARLESENTERSDWLSRKYHKNTKSVSTGYTFARSKRRTRRIVLSLVFSV